MDSARMLLLVREDLVEKYVTTKVYLDYSIPQTLWLILQAL
jgi:hypothetical protein